jgi:Protein of unknown function (DUF3365)
MSKALVEPSAQPDSVASRRPRRAWVALALVAAVAPAGCRPAAREPDGPGARERAIADAVHLVLSADREIYAKQVVDRLANQERVIRASEHWKDDKLLPLPAQMFRMGADRVRQQSKSLSYGLSSLWPINKQNGPHTDVETAGLHAVAGAAAGNHYAIEALATGRYFTAVYPDVAVSAACVDCHNGHRDSPRRDFKLGDVMGGMVVRVAIE